MPSRVLFFLFVITAMILSTHGQTCTNYEHGMNQALASKPHEHFTFHIGTSSQGNCSLTDPCTPDRLFLVMNETIVLSDFYKNTSSDRIIVITLELLSDGYFDNYKTFNTQLPQAKLLEYIIVFQSSNDRHVKVFFSNEGEYPVLWVFFKQVHTDANVIIDANIAFCKCKGRSVITSKKWRAFLYYEQCNMKETNIYAYYLDFIEITDSLFENFIISSVSVDQVLFQNSQFLLSKDPESTIMQGTGVSFYNCVLRGSSSLSMVGYTEVQFSNSSFYNTPVSAVIDTCIYVVISSCQFTQVTGGIQLSNVLETLVERSNFSWINGTAIRYKSSEYIVFNRKISMSRNVFENNTCDRGCGLLLEEISFTDLSNNVFRGNVASTNGAAIDAVSFLNVLGCVFENNRVNGNGGAIFYSGNSLSIDGCQFVDNSAQYGGALFSTGVLLFGGKKNHFMNNTAWIGGALFIKEAKVPFKNMLSWTEFLGNHAGFYGDNYLGGVTDVDMKSMKSTLFQSGTSLSFNVSMNVQEISSPSNIEKFTLIPNRDYVFVELFQNRDSFTIQLFLKKNISQTEPVTLSLRSEWSYFNTSFLNLTMLPCSEEYKLVDRNGVAVVSR